MNVALLNEDFPGSFAAVTSEMREPVLGEHFKELDNPVAFVLMLAAELEVASRREARRPMFVDLKVYVGLITLRTGEAVDLAFTELNPRSCNRLVETHSRPALSQIKAMEFFSR
jgi:hypothetical protein